MVGVYESGLGSDFFEDVSASLAGSWNLRREERGQHKKLETK